MSHAARAAAVAVTLVQLLVLGSVHAAEPTPNEIAVARRLFSEAAALREQGRWREASERLRRAIGIKDTPGLRYHLGHCQAQLGRLVEALVEYDRADELIRSGVHAPDVERLLDPARDELRERVPLLTIELPPTVEHALLEVDATEVSSFLVGQPMPVNPGSHRVTVLAPGHHRFERKVELAEGQKLVLRVELEAASQAGGAPVVEPAAPSTSRRKAAASRTAPSGLSARTYWLLGEGGVTLASLGFGVVFTFVEASASDRMSRARGVAEAEYKAVNPGSTSTSSSSFCHSIDPDRANWQLACDALNDASGERDRAELFALAGYIGAGVGATALVGTLLFWPVEKERVALHLMPVPTGFVGGLSGRF